MWDTRTQDCWPAGANRPKGGNPIASGNAKQSFQNPKSDAGGWEKGRPNNLTTDQGKDDLGTQPKAPKYQGASKLY